MRKINRIGVPAVLVSALVLWVLVSQSHAVRSLVVATHIVTRSATGLVTDSQNRPIAGATVYFIDTSLIDLTPIIPADITTVPAGSPAGTAPKAEAYDEPLEDVIKNPAKLTLLPKAVTNKQGKFTVTKLNIASTYFAFVSPAATDTNYLPGGDATRVAFSPKSITSKGLHITLSWSNLPPDFSNPDATGNATYIGSTACLSCHNGTTASDQSGVKRHIHSMMFVKPNQLDAHQDNTNYPSLFSFVNKFTLATAYSDAGVKTLYFDTYDNSQAQKWLIWEDTDISSTQQNAAALKLYLWKTAANNYYVTLKNQANPADPNNLITYQVVLQMGAYLRQRLLLKLPGSLPNNGPLTPPATLSYAGAYQFITFQGLNNPSSQGSNTNYFADRSRRLYQEGGPGGGGLTSFYTYNATTPSKSVIVATPPMTGSPAHATGGVFNCAVCHMGGNTTRQAANPTTGEILSHTVTDPNGVYDSNGDGQPDDLGITCETCHGPGSKHQAAANAPSDVVVARKALQPKNAKYIVNPKFLGSDRVALICGRCHSSGSQTNTANNFAVPGISRAQFLANYTNPTGTTPQNNGRGSLWPDGIHEKGGHESLTYSTFIRGPHYRNTRILVTCTDCHGLHGEATYVRALLYDPSDSASPLCQRCHERDVTQHVVNETGSAMTGESIQCQQCHMGKTGKGGAGAPGLILGTPTNTASDANIIYWQNDQTSHIMDMPTKFSVGVAGVVPGSIPYATNPIVGAMPVPYTNACGTCHDASKLQYQQPQ